MKRDEKVYLQHILDAIAKKVWLTATEDLPVLKEQVAAILAVL